MNHLPEKQLNFALKAHLLSHLVCWLGVDAVFAQQLIASPGVPPLTAHWQFAAMVKPWRGWQSLHEFGAMECSVKIAEGYGRTTQWLHVIFSDGEGMGRL